MRSVRFFGGKLFRIGQLELWPDRPSGTPEVLTSEAEDVSVDTPRGHEARDGKY